MAERVCHRAIERLRGKSMKPNHRVLREHGPWGRCDVVLLADAEAAVVAAVDASTAEIVEWLGTVEAVEELYGIPEARLNAEELEFGTASLAGVAEALARRFPNGGTNDAS